MPSSAPTVSKAAGRAAHGRPEAWEVEGPGPIPAARALETGDHGRLHPGRVSARPPAQTGRGGKRGSGTVAPACLPWLPPDACVAGLSGLASLPLDQPLSGFSDSRAAWEAPRSLPPSGSAGEEETWLPPGDNARENLGSTSRRGREPG